MAIKLEPEVKYDPITLSLFANRFMGIAEAMGRSLRQTSISTNIKERLDYSCAVFSYTGDLVANAPFVPVHLGAMSFAIKFQLKRLAGQLLPGDVLLANSPVAGGSHLPDLTVMTPIFDKKGDIIFFTASRAHHADIGGILGGSMPATSTMLAEEGAEIISFKMVKEGKFDDAGLYDLLVTQPGKFPGGSGCRNYHDAESDLKAQAAANHKGSLLLSALVAEYTLPVVHAYMGYIQQNAERAVRNMLIQAAKTAGKNVLTAVDYLDDGSPIALTITIDTKTGDATLDFTGTGNEVRGNVNAPISVVHSAIIYCMRAMVNQDIPLNAGCLVPLNIIIPNDSLLNPSPAAAVCAGNVLTSQRITDVVLKAFQACAASTGCTNNVSFGVGGTDQSTGELIKGWGYYEALGGGSGAGPSWNGASGVHCHMTNTRITDPETLERRYPVILREFGYHSGSGGPGEYYGGEGLLRDMELLQNLQISVISERRSRAPYGLAGGQEAGMGVNTWMRRDAEHGGYRKINIGGKAIVRVGQGDRLVMATPGGGGWGKLENRKHDDAFPTKHAWEPRGSLAEKAAAEAAFG